MCMKLPSLKSEHVRGKTVIVRVDYNVPLKKVGDRLEITDDRRIIASLETIRFLLQNQAKVILISHLGRPQSADDLHLSLQPIAEYLTNAQKLPCQFFPKFNFPEIKLNIDRTKNPTLFMLENLRFDKREKQDDLGFARELASLAEIYVNEAFSTTHRKHASTYTLAKLLPHFAGFGLIKEVETLSLMLQNPIRPFVCVIGGAKIGDKVEAITHLAQKADIILTGGGIANTFLEAEGIEIFRSPTKEKEEIEHHKSSGATFAHQIIQAHKHERMLKDGYIPLPKILYPVDVIAAKSIDEQNAQNTQIFDLTHDMRDTLEREKWLYLDIGPKTQRLYREIISQAETVFWNGPMGVWENPIFGNGTWKIARAIADGDVTSIIGGGDTIAATDHYDLNRLYSYISTGGGATLQLLSGKLNPGIEVLLDSNHIN